MRNLCSIRWVLIAAAGVVALLTLVVPAHASVSAPSDSYISYLVGQLRQDPVYISSYSSMASPSDTPAVERLIARLPLKTYVVADVGAGPDGEMSDSDLAAILHDQLGGGLFIFARGEDSVSATGFGTSLPVSDAMSAAFLELGSGGAGVTLIPAVQRFEQILFSGKTEQDLAAVDNAPQPTGQAPSWEVPGGVATGTVLGGGLTVALFGRRKRRRLNRRATA